MEKTTETVASENAELFCVYYQKGCVDRAMATLEHVLQAEMVKRKSRAAGQQQPPMKQPWPHPMSVYENFARSLPGFQAAEMSAAAGSAHSAHRVLSHSTRTAEDQLCSHILAQVERAASPLVQLAASSSFMANAFACCRSLRDTVLAAAQSPGETRVVDLLYKSLESLVLVCRALPAPSTPTESEALQRVRDCHLLVLRAIAESYLYPRHKVLLKSTEVLLKLITDGRLFSAAPGGAHLPLRALPLSYAQPSPLAEVLEALLRPGPSRLVNVLALDMELARLLEASLSQQQESLETSPRPVAAYVVDAIVQILKCYCFGSLLREPNIVSSINEVRLLDLLIEPRNTLLQYLNVATDSCVASIFLIAVM